jgi:hypothetical protein
MLLLFLFIHSDVAKKCLVMLSVILYNRIYNGNYVEFVLECQKNTPIFCAGEKSRRKRTIDYINS